MIEIMYEILVAVLWVLVVLVHLFYAATITATDTVSVSVTVDIIARITGGVRVHLFIYAFVFVDNG